MLRVGIVREASVCSDAKLAGVKKPQSQCVCLLAGDPSGSGPGGTVELVIGQGQQSRETGTGVGC